MIYAISMTNYLVDADYPRIRTKYAHLRFPAFIQKDNPLEGLLDPGFFNAFQRQFMLKDRQALGILIAAPDPADIEDKWDRADYLPNHGSAEWWAGFCALLREDPKGELACTSFGREIAKAMERHRRGIAYICCHGLFDFALPIFCNDYLIAVLFTGQFIPAAGKVWHPDLREAGGIFQALPEGTEGIDLQSFSLDKIKSLGDKYGFPAQKTRILIESVKNELNNPSSKRILTPADVAKLQAQLDETSRQFTLLAEKSFFYEKSWLRSRLRSYTDQLLRPLLDNTFDSDQFLAGLRQRINHLCDYMDLELFALIQHRGREKILELTAGRGVEQYFPETPFRTRCSIAQIQPLLDACPSQGGWFEYDLNQLAQLPVFDRLLPNAGQEQHLRMFSFRHTDYSHTLMILGPADPDREIRRNDQEDLEIMLFHLGQAISGMRMVEELKASTSNQALMIEAVAHDLRSPIQNVMIKSQTLRRDRRMPKEIAPQVRQFGAQLQRINMLSQRVFTLAKILNGEMEIQLSNVKVSDIIRESVQLLEERAAVKKIKIVIEPERPGSDKPFFRSWPFLILDADFFLQALVNLLDNAIKYSYDETDIIINGSTDGAVYNIRVGNVGIPIPTEDMENIWERGFRSIHARQFLQEGTGLGLVIVRQFADRFGDVTVTSNPIRINEHLNIFQLSIDTGRAQHE